MPLKKFILLICTIFLFHPLTAQNINQPKEPHVIFLVRHAEKVDNSRNPKLSKPGKERALELAKVLRDSKITHIHSTDYTRTLKTAEPTAQKFNLEIELYNPSELNDFAKELKSIDGRHLVVGHSNTTPELVRLLEGEPGEPIEEKNEYDRLYILSESKEGTMETVLLRYGKKFELPE